MTRPDSAPSTRRAPLAMDREAFRSAGHALVDMVAEFLETLPQRPVTRGEAPEVIRELIDAAAPLPEQGADAEPLLRAAANILFDHSLFNGHPRFFGYITSSPAPIGMLAELLAAAVNANVGAWQLAPVASEIEAQTIRWIAELIGYPAGGGGLLVSGGNMANMVGLLTARTAALGEDVRNAGLFSKPRLRVYASAETHTWLDKAADLYGLGTDAIRRVGVDEDLRMDIDALRRALVRDREAGETPMMVVANGGSVSTGAIDDLPAIAALCRDEGVWFHVDGAYGGFAAAVPDAPAELRALALADSVALDPHKWLYAPIEAGCVLVRDAAHLRNAFSYHPPYYHFGQEAVNYVDHGPQNSRGFRALKVWLALKQVGREGYVRMISDDMRLSRYLHDLVGEHPELDAVAQGLSVTAFRYVPPDLQPTRDAADVHDYLNRLNEALLDHLQRSGEAFVSNAVIRGTFVLRACVVNFNTTEADMEAMPEIVARAGRRLDADLRPSLTAGAPPSAAAP